MTSVMVMVTMLPVMLGLHYYFSTACHALGLASHPAPRRFLVVRFEDIHVRVVAPQLFIKDRLLRFTAL